VQQGNKVKITENQLTFYSTVGVKTIQLTPAEVVSLNITHFKLEKDQLRLLRDRLLARNLERRIGLPLDERAKHIFKKMSQKQKVWTLSEWQEVTNYLIGRGKGLTPSGDDILVAYQTILFILAD
ncbi:oxamate carbamoyltransferase subunit AllH family protein, partial [Escherichia coli]